MKKQKLLFFTFSVVTFIPIMCIVIRLNQYGLENHNQSDIAKVVSCYTLPSVDVEILSDIRLNSRDFLDIEGMKEENGDIAAYIRIDGTQVDYPVLRAEDKEKYLRRDFYGESSLYGSIYMDNACYEGGTNIVLYGHNMKSGKMFGQLKEYRNSDFLTSHSYVKYIDTESVHLYKIISVFSAPADEENLIQVLVPYSEQEFNLLQKFIQEKTLAAGTIDLEWGDKLLTLVTCEYTHRDGRLFVIGKLEKTIEIEKE